VEEGVVMASSRIPVLVAVIVAFPACFDVSSGNKTSLLIDDFDRVDLLPADPHFDQWRCGRFKPDTAQNCACWYDEETYHSSPRSIHLAAALQDVPDGVQDFGGAQLYTQANVPEDLSHMSRIAFSAMLVPPPIVTGAALYVELHCSLAQPKGTSLPSQRYLHNAVEYTNTAGWQSFVIDLTNDRFVEPTNYKGAGIVGGLAACLERIDGIHFSVNAQLPDGEPGAVLLYLDDVYFQ
jgi:hypothetical protein